MARWTNKRRLFLEHYFACNMNATEAARRAGYVYPNKQGPVLVNLGIIHDAIVKRLEEMAMESNEVLSRLGEIAGATITDFIGDNGGINWEAVKERGHLIRRVTHQKGQRSTIELHDSLATLMHLDKHHGGPSKGPIPHRVEVDDARLTNEDRIDRLAVLLDAARERRDRRDPGDVGVASVVAAERPAD